MKSTLYLPLVLLLAALHSHAQGASIWRCGNTYTNDAAQAKAQGCKPMEGGNVTVVEGTKVHNTANTRTSAPAASAPAARPASEKVDAADQKARDADARHILEAELKKAEARHAELLKEYNNGEPERRGDERNYQKYLDRVAELKAGIARNESDIAGLRRELGRLPGSSAAVAK